MGLMLCVKVNFRDAEKIKSYLIENNLFDHRFQLIRDNEYLYFPVIKEFNISGAAVSFIEKQDNFKKESEHDLRKVLENKLSLKQLEHLKTSFDIVGDIAILEIDDELKKKEKIIAKTVLELHPHIKTVVKK